MSFDRYELRIKFIRSVLGTNPLDPDILRTHIHKKQQDIITGKDPVNKKIIKYIDALKIEEAKQEKEISNLIAKLQEFFGEEADVQKLYETGDLSKLLTKVKDVEAKGTTVFFWNNEKNLPMIASHMVNGFLKEAAEAVAATYPRKNGTLPNSAVYAVSQINRYVRCVDEFICFDRDILRDDDGRPAYKIRSLRTKGGPQGPRTAIARSEEVPAGASLEPFQLYVKKDCAIQLKHLELWLDHGFLSGFGQWRNAGHGCFTYEIEKLT